MPQCSWEGCTNETRISKAGAPKKYCPACSRTARKIWLEKIRDKAQEQEKKYEGFSRMWAQAIEAGTRAAESCKPVPMMVGDPKSKNPFAPDAEIDTEKEHWIVEGGACGFAWIHIPNGRCSFLQWAKKNIPGQFRKSYRGGDDFHVSGYGHEMTRKSEFATAAAAILCEGGITAYATSRID